MPSPFSSTGVRSSVGIRRRFLGKGGERSDKKGHGSTKEGAGYSFMEAPQMRGLWKGQETEKETLKQKE